MALPAQISYFTCTGKLMRAAADSADADTDPDGVPMQGQVTFSPEIGRRGHSGQLLGGGRITVASATPPLVVVVDPVPVALGADGSFSVKLIAPDDPDIAPSGWTWTATFALVGAVIPAFSFTGAAGATVDLAVVAPIEIATGGLTFINEAAASAASAAASAASAATAASLVGAPADTVIAALLANPASATKTSLSGTYARNTTGLYNATDTNMRRWNAALARAAAGTGYARLNCYGDSITFGSYATPNGANGWVGRLRTRLLAKLDQASGSGVEYLMHYWTFAEPASLVTLTGTPPLEVPGFGPFGSVLQNLIGLNNTVISFGPVMCTEFRVQSIKGNTGEYRVDVDGGADTVVNVANVPITVNDCMTTVIPAGALGLHTLHVKPSNTQDWMKAQIASVEAAGPSGLLVSRIALPGGPASALFPADAVGHSGGTAFAVDQMLPDLSVIAFGSNEFSTQQPLATFSAAVQGVIDAVKAHGDIILMSTVPRSVDPAPAISQSEYQQVLHDLAASNNVALLDVAKRWESWSAASTSGLMFDQAHPNNAGYMDIAAMLAAVLAPGY